jgi:hypothetical protein
MGFERGDVLGRARLADERLDPSGRGGAAESDVDTSLGAKSQTMTSSDTNSSARRSAPTISARAPLRCRMPTISSAMARAWGSTNSISPASLVRGVRRDNLKRRAGGTQR